MSISISIPLKINATLQLSEEQWESIKNDWSKLDSDTLSEAEVDEMEIWEALKDARDNLSISELVVDED